MKKSNVILIVILAVIVIGGLIYINQKYSANRCAKEGEFTSPQQVPEEQVIDCCEGLSSFYPWGGRTDGSLLCYDSEKGLPECKFIDTENEGWYYSGTEEIIEKMSCQDVNPLIGGCAGVHNIYWNECCENWAEENDIVKAACVGNWTVENNSCVWRCSTDNQCNNNTDCYPEGVEPGTDGGLFYQCIGGKCHEGSSQRSPIN